MKTLLWRVPIKLHCFCNSTPPLLVLGYVIVLETFQYGYFQTVWHVLCNSVKLSVILLLVLYSS